MSSLPLVVGVVALTAIGHLLLKVGMDRIGSISAEDLRSPLTVIRQIVSSPMILLAMPIYAVSFFGWLIVLSRVKLSVAYPSLGLMYVIVPVLSWLVLRESVPAIQWGGIALVILGVLVVFRVGAA